jgi:hypothetical protein
MIKVALPWKTDTSHVHFRGPTDGVGRAPGSIYGMGSEWYWQTNEWISVLYMYAGGTTHSLEDAKRIVDERLVNIGYKLLDDKHRAML